MIERQIEVETRDGRMNTFICHPERDGAHPVILFFMDAPGVREELRDMARRLASTGYYVMLPNLYYRAGEEDLGAFVGADEAAGEVRKKMFALMNDVAMANVMQDADDLIAFALADPAADKGPMGTLGYCMSGQFAINTAARHPDRVRAAASIYGVRLLTDEADSPHVMAKAAKAEIYVAWAETDHYAPLELLEPFTQALAGDGVNAEVELYKGVEHGFAFPGRPAYDKPAAERHWERLFALYGRNLSR